MAHIISMSYKMDISNIKLRERRKQEYFLRLRDVMIIRSITWAGHPRDAALWEGSVNGIVEDWNTPDSLIRQAERKGIAWVILRYHRNGYVSCVKKSN